MTLELECRRTYDGIDPDVVVDYSTQPECVSLGTDLDHFRVVSPQRESCESEMIATLTVEVGLEPCGSSGL